MAKQASKSDLHAKMQGEETTNAWDVLVAYSQDQLNAFLKKAWSRSERFSQIHLEVPIQVGIHKYIQVYDLKLHAPTLEFATNEQPASAYLQMGSKAARRISAMMTRMLSKSPLESTVSESRFRSSGSKEMGVTSRCV